MPVSWSFLIYNVAMVVFHHFVTLHEEVAQFNRPKLSGAIIIYMANRYFILADYISSMPLWSIERTHNTDCVGTTITLRVLSLVAYLPPAAFSGLRSWALLRSTPVAIIIFVLSSSPLVVNAVALHWSTIDVDSLYGCGFSQDVPPELNIIRHSRPAPTHHSRSCCDDYNVVYPVSLS
ncbi:hypothetical protein BD413DRAFT_81466 [Trametes elegans]|nr:hypothetical protein BD413DRAFT_81466 [Trametes elegans]